MTRATILPAPAGPLTLADRYEQAARAVEAYIAARRALSVAALGKGSLTPVIEALTLIRRNAAAIVRDLAGEWPMTFETTARLAWLAADLRDSNTTVEGDTDEVEYLRALAAAAGGRRDTEPPAESTEPCGHPDCELCLCPCGLPSSDAYHTPEQRAACREAFPEPCREVVPCEP